MMSRIAFLRHGHTSWNRAGLIQGRSNQPLDEEARCHLERLQLPDGFGGGTIVASPLQRAVETARLVCLREPAIVPELEEMDWGRWQGRRGTDLLETPDSGYCHVEGWGWDFQPPGGETPAMVWQRVKPWIYSTTCTCVAVTHVGVMRVVLAKATGWEFKGPPPFKIKRDRLYVVEVGPDGSLSFDGNPIRLVPAEQ